MTFNRNFLFPSNVSWQATRLTSSGNESLSRCPTRLLRGIRKVSFICLAICLCIFSGCATVPRYSVAQESLEDLCKQFNINFSYDEVVRSAIIVKNNVKAYILVDSAVASVNSERILLDAPVSLKHSEVYVSQDFRKKVLCRMDSRLCVDQMSPENFTIIIDPGHGGKDSGATGEYYLKEKDIVLDISGRLMRQLKQYGYDVRMTRDSDQFISLERRTEDATEKKADMFISIHANASTSDRAFGFEVWAPRVLTYVDFNEAQRKKNYQIMFRRLNMQKQHSFLEKTLEDMLYQYKYAESLRLADEISKNCSRGISTSNRGVKQSGFFVLRNTLVPSVLVEVGFVSNSKEASRLKSSSYRQDLAEMIAQGIQNYVKSL